MATAVAMPSPACEPSSPPLSDEDNKSARGPSLTRSFARGLRNHRRPSSLVVSPTDSDTPANDRPYSKLIEASAVVIGAKATRGLVSESQRPAYFNQAMDAAKTVTGAADAVADHAKAIIKDSSALDAVHSFADHLHVFLKGLEEVAKLHPFIHVATLAFGTVCALELKRRSNEEKVHGMLVEMEDMLAVLTHLRYVEPGYVPPTYGKTIEEHMSGMVEKTAEDIKKSGNLCDVYTKSTKLDKALRAHLWENKFIKFVEIFSRRKSDFKFVLATYTAVKVDDIDLKVDEVNDRTEEILKLIRDVPVELKKLHDLIARKGGADAVLASPELLREVIASDPDAIGSSKADKQASGTGRRNSEDIRKFFQDLDDHIAGNLGSFERKFAIQQQHVEEQIHQEADRVIVALKSGPHDRIVDPDFRAVWKEMGWRGNVKARHVTMAMRDFYNELAEEKKHQHQHSPPLSPPLSPQLVPAFPELSSPEPTGSPLPTISDADIWALPWITVKRLQLIVEALDEDASGYVTVAEVNKFTASKPSDWSLLRWFAYWAIGWQATNTIYRDKINRIFSKMFALKASIHDSNRQIVDQYLDNVWQPLILLTSSVQSFTPPAKIQARFQSYVDNEEKRIKQNLEHLQYHIDDHTTLLLATGPGRIEKYLFMVMYLLVKRDLQVMRLCQKKKIDQRELWESVHSLRTVLAAVEDRYNYLREIYRHQGIEPSQQFKVSYGKLFDHFHDPSILFTRKKLRDLTFHDEHDHSEDYHEQDLDILKYSNDSVDSLHHKPDYSAYKFDLVTLEEYEKPRSPLDAIQGKWNAVLYSNEGVLAVPMLSLTINAAPDSGTHKFTGLGSSAYASFALSGDIKDSEGTIFYHFDMDCPAPLYSRHFRGHLSENGVTLQGTWGSAEEQSGQFVLSRIRSDILRCRPSPADFQRKLVRAHWKFAIAAVKQKVNSCSWTVIRHRRDVRRRYVDLLFRTHHGRPLNDEEIEEFNNLQLALTPEDSQFYQSLCDVRLRSSSIHGIPCDSCNGPITGSRIVCLDCDMYDRTFSTLDLCDDPRCQNAEIGLDRRPDLPSPHLPSHDVFKSKRTIHLKDFGKVEIQAREAIQRAKTVVDELKLRNDEHSDSDSPRHEHGLKCASCKKKIERSCWMCIDCEDDVFICDDCDSHKWMAINESSPHRHDHTFVRVRLPEQDSRIISLDHRLAIWENKLGMMDHSITQITQHNMKVEDRLEQLDQRMLRLEGLLELLTKKLLT